MPNIQRQLKPSGALGLTLLRADPYRGRAAAHPIALIMHGLPRPGLSREINLWRLKNIPNLWRGLWKIWFAMLAKIPTHYGVLYFRVQRGPGGAWEEWGTASLRVITDAGVAFIASDFNNGATDVSTMKYHGFGTGTGAEAAGDTALGTELTTEYVTNSTRPTGSQAASTNTYTTVGTLSPDSGGTLAITEHGIFSANASGTLLDRSKFSAVNLVAGADSLQATYVLTLASGG